MARTRAAILALVPETDPLRPVADLLAHTLRIGREDGYPTRAVADECLAVVMSARAAMGASSAAHPLNVIWGSSDYLHLHDLAEDAHDADYAAWRAATEYRSDVKRSAARLCG